MTERFCPTRNRKKTGLDLYLFLAGLSNEIISNQTEKSFAGQPHCPKR